MTGYIFRRLLRGVLVLVLVSLVVFGMNVLAGDPIALLVPPETTREQLEHLRTLYGLNDPVPVRFVRFLGGVLHGDFGDSFRFGQPAFTLVVERLGATLELALAAFILTVLLAVPGGLVAALRKGSRTDAVIVVGSAVGHSVPPFVLGILLIYALGLRLGLLPTAGRGTLGHLIMPALTLGAFGAGRVARILRASLVDALDQDYLRTARAKGLGAANVVGRHALKNAALPVLTLLGLEVGALLGGAVVTETVFAWPGIGKLAVDAVLARDHPVVQAVTLVVATGFVLTNLIVDVLCLYLDPRIRFRA